MEGIVTVLPHFRSRRDDPPCAKPLCRPRTGAGHEARVRQVRSGAPRLTQLLGSSRRFEELLESDEAKAMRAWH